MGLNITLEAIRPTEVFEDNITHNLNKMADACGLYYYIWRPEETEVKVAGDLIPHLEGGLKLLLGDSEYYKSFNPPNGWGSYEGFVGFVQKYLQACRDNPDATMRACR